MLLYKTNMAQSNKQCMCVGVVWGGVGWRAGIITKILDDNVHMLYKTGTHQRTEPTWGSGDGMGGRGGGGGHQPLVWIKGATEGRGWEKVMSD